MKQESFAFRRGRFNKLLGGIPKKMVQWQRILEVLLPIRTSLCDIEETPVGVRVIDMQNLLNELSSQLLQIKLSPPILQDDFELYWRQVTQWILDFTASLSQGE